MHVVSSFFFFNDTATTEIYPLSLHDALPISRRRVISSPAGDSAIASIFVPPTSMPMRTEAVYAALAGCDRLIDGWLSGLHHTTRKAEAHGWGSQGRTCRSDDHRADVVRRSGPPLAGRSIRLPRKRPRRHPDGLTRGAGRSQIRAARFRGQLVSALPRAPGIVSHAARSILPARHLPPRVHRRRQLQ